MKKKGWGGREVGEGDKEEGGKRGENERGGGREFRCGREGKAKAGNISSFLLCLTER